MAAGLGFKTFTTGEVLTAGDTNGYLMQGVLVFADAAARSAAITSPQEGQTSYLKSDDTIYTYSGSAWVAAGGLPSQTGNSGKYLTTDGTNPSWGTVAAGGMTLLSTTTLSGTSVVVSSINQTYNYLQVFVTGIDFAAVDQMIIRPNSATSNQNNAVISTASATAVTSTSRWNTSQARNVKATSNEGVVILSIYNYASTTAWKTADWTSAFFDDTSSTNTAFFGYGMYSSTDAITSLQFRTDSGTNAFDGGTIKIYGVK